MLKIAAVLLVVLPLSAPFGDATATATSLDDGLWLDVSVEVEGSPVAVIVRGLAPGDSELPPVALADRGDGRWEGIVKLPVVENIFLGFEIIPASGPATVSELHTLTELGVDSAIFSMDNPETLFGENDEPLVTLEGERWGWLGVAAGAAALAFLAYWTVGTVRGRADEDELDIDAETLAVEEDSITD